MKTKRNLLIAGAGLAVCFITARLAITVAEERHRGSYSVENWITTPEYRTDAGLAIDAYERLMERYADLAEAQLMDCQVIAEKMDSLDAKISDLSTRIARIEKALGIDPNGNNPSKATKKLGMR